MPDRVKVIKGLTEISEYARVKADIAGIGKGKEVFDSWYRAVEDALALLREQEAVDPVEMVDTFDPEEYSIGTLGWICGHCGIEELKNHAEYCPRCGRKVKWCATD